MACFISWQTVAKWVSFFVFLGCVQKYFMVVMKVMHKHFYEVAATSATAATVGTLEYHNNALQQMFEAALILAVFGIPVFLKIVQMFFNIKSRNFRQLSFQIGLALVVMNLFAYKTTYRLNARKSLPSSIGKENGADLDFAKLCFVFGCLVEFFY